MKRRISTFLPILLLLGFVGTSFSGTLVDNCRNYRQVGDYKRAIETGKLAIRRYPKNADAHFCLGASYNMTGEFKRAIIELKSAERFASGKNDLNAIYNWLGSTYKSLGDVDNALFYDSKSLALSRDLGNKKSEAAELNNIARIFEKKGDFDKALDYLDQSLNLLDEKDRAPVYHSLGVIYRDKGNYQKAIEYEIKAITLDERNGDYHYLAIHSITLGNSYRLMKDFSQANNYLNDGLEKIKQVGDRDWEATAYLYFGWLYEDTGDIQKAKNNLNTAYEIFKSIGAKDKEQDVLNSFNRIGTRK